MKRIAPILILFALGFSVSPAAAGPGNELAARLDSVQQGTSFARLKLSVQDPPGTETVSRQIQIKERRAGGTADVLYQVLYPREQKGQSVLLKQSGSGAPSGHHFVPPDKLEPLSGSGLGGAAFGSDLTYRDLIENFFAWQDQSLVGQETVEGRECQILESKPAGGQSDYGSVRSWIDTGRLVPLRVEKYDRSGNIVRRIDTTRVHKNDNGHHIPATIMVRRPGTTSITQLEGSRSKVNVTYSDADFTVPKMTDLSAPR
ncbi:hypothetical protein BH23VER1_BH23VER1_14870 [soil metagenome]